MDVAADHTLGGDAGRFLRGARDALLPEVLLGLGDVAIALGEGLLAVHHARTGLVTELLDELGTDGGLGGVLDCGLSLRRRLRLDSSARLHGGGLGLGLGLGDGLLCGCIHLHSSRRFLRGSDGITRGDDVRPVGGLRVAVADDLVGPAIGVAREALRGVEVDAWDVREVRAIWEHGAHNAKLLHEEGHRGRDAGVVHVL